MRKILVGIAITTAVTTAPATVGADPAPNGRNCVGVADRRGRTCRRLRPGRERHRLGSPGAIATSLEAFVSANCSRSGPGR